MGSPASPHDSRLRGDFARPLSPISATAIPRFARPLSPIIQFNMLESRPLSPPQLSSIGPNRCAPVHNSCKNAIFCATAIPLFAANLLILGCATAIPRDRYPLSCA